MDELNELIETLQTLKNNIDTRSDITSLRVWSIHKDSKYSKVSIKKQIKQVKLALSDFANNL